MTVADLVALLRCPVCGGQLSWEPVAQVPALTEESGLLRCACAVYPVLDGVPILLRDRLDYRSIADQRVVGAGPSVADVLARVQDGDGARALVDLLSFPVCPWPLNRVRPLRRWSRGGPHHAVGMAARRRRIGRMLDRQARLTAEDWLAAFYWHAPAPFDPFNYFFFRFGQPRYLATLGLLSALPALDRPLLDLACGYGHLLHAFTAGGQRAVGLDQNFHQVWVARRYVAPGAAFVCADADRPLPFRDGAVAGALCADVFHHLHHKAAVVADLRRCTGDGPILLASVSNRLVEPPEGDDLSPDEYAALLGPGPVRVQTHGHLLRRYLAGLKPDLRVSDPPPEAGRAKWLYLVAASDDQLFVDHGSLGEWPHAAGRVQVNPIYEAEGDRLVFRFPSPWFETENREMRDYMPASVPRTGADPAALLARGVLLGLPERYVRPAGRPRTLRANRALGALVGRLGAGLRR